MWGGKWAAWGHEEFWKGICIMEQPNEIKSEGLQGPNLAKLQSAWHPTKAAKDTEM